jgi:hypothetical protein
MSLSAGSQASTRAVSVVRMLGYLVFLTAFFLPAARETKSHDTLQGWFCAWITVINTFNHELWTSKFALAILSGWINPLMLIYVACLFSRRLRAVRRIAAGVIVILVLCAWACFWLMQLTPLVGHFLWVAGILMIVAGEVLSPKPAVAPPPAETAAPPAPSS